MTQDEHKARFKTGLEVHRIVAGSVYTVEGCKTLCRRCHDDIPRRPNGSPDYGKPKRVGVVSVCIEFPRELIERFEAFWRKRGVHRALKYELVEAMERHLAYPPAPAPLGDSPAKKHRGKKGG